MASTRTPLAKSSKKSWPQVQHTSSINDKEVVEKVAKLQIRRNVRTMGPNEAISSATKSPALQRALDIIRSGGTQAQHKKIKAKGKSKVVPPKSMGIRNKGETSNIPLTMTKNSNGIVTTAPEDHEIIPTIKSFEIEIKGKTKVGMHQEKISKKVYFDYEVPGI